MISIRPTGVVNEVEKPLKEENKKYPKENENIHFCSKVWKHSRINLKKRKIMTSSKILSSAIVSSLIIIGNVT